MAERLLRDRGATGATTDLHRWSRLHRDALLAYFRRRTRRLEDAEDLVQEVFARLAQVVDLSAVEHVDRYLFRSARNVLTDWRRKSVVRRTGDHHSLPDDLPDVDFSPERVLIGRDALEMLARALEDLPPRTSAIFARHHFEGRSYREIGDAMGIAVRTVEDHMARANAQLRKIVLT